MRAYILFGVGLLITPARLASQVAPLPLEVVQAQALEIRFGTVDSAFLEFGVDTASLRRAIEEELQKDSITVFPSRASAPAERAFVLQLDLGLERSAVPQIEPIAVVALKILPPEPTTHRPLWASLPTIWELTAYRLLGERTPDAVRSQIRRFLRARRGVDGSSPAARHP
jgi:hypothetical protein